MNPSESSSIYNVNIAFIFDISKIIKLSLISFLVGI